MSLMMKSILMVVALLGLSWIGEQSLRAQTSTAVVADPPVDTMFPPGLMGITIPSHTSDPCFWTGSLSTNAHFGP
jgi:hypothetical protein